MRLQTSSSILSKRRGFTLIELLVAMALIVAGMSVTSEAFVTGIASFRQLKGIGDLNEGLREDIHRFDVRVHLVRLEATEFLADGLRTGIVDREEAADLQEECEAICADAIDLDTRLRVVDAQTTNPVARQVMRHTLESLKAVKKGAARMVVLLEPLTPQRQGD